MSEETRGEIRDQIIQLIDGDDCGRCTMENYNKALTLAVDDEKLLDDIIVYKILNYIEWAGTYNYTPYYMLLILKIVKSSRDNEEVYKILNSYGFEKKPLPKYWLMYDIHDFINVPQEFVMCILSVLCDKDIVEYGTSLGSCWITKKGEELLNPEYSDFYREMLNLGPVWSYVNGDKVDISLEYAW